MIDDQTRVGHQDNGLIDTSENYEIEYWSTKFNVSVEVLKTAVKAVGNSVEAVKKYLNK